MYLYMRVYVFINKSLFKKKIDFIYLIIVGECVYKEKIEDTKWIIRPRNLKNKQYKSCWIHVLWKGGHVLLHSWYLSYYY
jgi:hypothetical protein